MKFKHDFSVPACLFVRWNVKIEMQLKLGSMGDRILLLQECDFLRDHYFPLASYDQTFRNTEVRFFFLGL